MTTKGDYEEKYKKFFIEATGIKEGPYPYQVRLATDEAFPELLDVPTGLGKTAGGVLAWAVAAQTMSDFLKRISFVD